MGVLAVATLTACASTPPTPVERTAVCPLRVAPVAPDLPLRPVADPGAPGAVAASVGVGMLAMLTIYAPLAPIIAGKLIECGVARSRYPQASAELGKALAAAGPATLGPAIETILEARFPGCRPDEDAGVDARTLHVDGIEYAVSACPVPDMAWKLDVHWHVDAGPGALKAGERSTLQAHCSALEPAAWLGDPARARTEAGISLAHTAEAMVDDLRGTPRPPTCMLVYVAPEPAPPAAPASD